MTRGRTSVFSLEARTIEKFLKAADERPVPLGELLGLAFDVLERIGGCNSDKSLPTSALHKLEWHALWITRRM